MKTHNPAHAELFERFLRRYAGNCEDKYHRCSHRSATVERSGELRPGLEYRICLVCFNKIQTSIAEEVFVQQKRQLKEATPEYLRDIALSLKYIVAHLDKLSRTGIEFRKPA